MKEGWEEKPLALLEQTHAGEPSVISHTNVGAGADVRIQPMVQAWVGKTKSTGREPWTLDSQATSFGGSNNGRRKVG